MTKCARLSGGVDAAFSDARPERSVDDVAVSHACASAALTVPRRLGSASSSVASKSSTSRDDPDGCCHDEPDRRGYVNQGGGWRTHR